VATISDVAKLAGVSRMTVSRVINQKGPVTEKTRNIVNSAIKELNFRPNIVAKSLVTKKTHTIAYVMVNIADPFHSTVSKGIETCSYLEGYTTMICDTHSKHREQDYIHLLIDRGIDGAVFHHLAFTEAQVQGLEDSGVKCVLMDNEIDLPHTCEVNTDNYAGAMMAVDHLVSRGHRRIACIHGVLKRPRGKSIPYEDTFQYNIWRQRTQGYLNGLQRHNLPREYLYQGNGLEEIAVVCIPRCLEMILREKERPTAVYCENDIMAIMFLNAMIEKGLKAPNDIAVMGHDGLSICRMLHPYITTIAQPCYEMGYHAAAMLIQRIRNPIAVQKSLLKPQLNIGETT
jgi:LacI family transcriptional regulator